MQNADKSGLKSAPTVVVTQPSADLNKYLVDKFHPPTTSAKPALFESIDLSLYQPSAKCAAFLTSESRLLRWIRVFKTRYFEYLNSDATGYKAVWKEQEAYSSPSKCEKIVIHLFDTSSTLEEQLVTLTVFISTSRILIQGKKHKEWCTAEFPVLLEIVNKVKLIPSVEDESLFTSLISNFFGNIITFISEDEIHTSQRSQSTKITTTDATEETTSMSKAPLSVEPLSSPRVS